MNEEDNVSLFDTAVAEFNQHENRADAARIAASLCAGLSVLRDSFYRRLHDDIQKNIGMDSMLAPLSPHKSETLTKIETEIYQSAESGAIAQTAAYVSDGEWYVRWLLRIRMGQAADDPKISKRLAHYASRNDRDRRLALSNVLVKIFPESQRVPLILFLLFPLSARIATALAFGDHARAAALRDEQAKQLPVILDCRECRGGLLDNGQQCRLCANPVWKWEYLADV